MTAFYLLVPFLFIRFIFLSLLDRKATGRAAHFASMQGKEIIAYYLYQLSTLMLLIVPFFLKVTLHFSSFFYLGLGAYLLGSVLLFLVIKDFANPDEKGLNTKGLYALSRHPMYIAYNVYCLFCFIFRRGDADSVVNTAHFLSDFSTISSLYHTGRGERVFNKIWRCLSRIPKTS